MQLIVTPLLVNLGKTGNIEENILTGCGKLGIIINYVYRCDLLNRMKLGDQTLSERVKNAVQSGFSSSGIVNISCWSGGLFFISSERYRSFYKAARG